MTSTHESAGSTRRLGTSVGKVLDMAAAVVKLVGMVFALLLVGNILLTVFDANPSNELTMFFASASTGLTLWFENLFTPASPKMAIVVNHGLAAIFWLVAAALVARILRAAR
ncbi:MAG TPA: hypothetical protein VGH99_17880 [Pseudonocardia sp.]|jgi:hypothetical protein